MTTLYGIKNCDTVKKARTWLDDHAIQYSFYDFKTQGATQTQIKQWILEIGLETLVNKRGTSWRNLDEITKENFNEKNAVKLLSEQPTLIKRPLLDTGKIKTVGFSETEYKNIFLTK